MNYSWKFVANVKIWRRKKIKQGFERLKSDPKTAAKPLSCTLKFNFFFVNSFSLNCLEATERSAFVFTLHRFHAFKQNRWKITRSRLKASWFFWSLTYGSEKEEKFPRWCSFAVYCCFLSVWRRDKKQTRKKFYSGIFGVLRWVFDRGMLFCYYFSDGCKALLLKWCCCD